MGITITTNDDLSLVATEFIPAVATGLEYANFFSGSGVMSRNLAAGKAAATVVGSPVQNTQFIRCTGGTAYIQTQVAQTAEYTWIAVAKPVSDAALATAAMISNNSGNIFAKSEISFLQSTLGDGLLLARHATATDLGGGTYGEDLQVAANVANLTDPKAYAARFNAARLKIFNRLTDAAVLSATQSTALGVDPTKPLRIGSNYQVLGETDIYCAFMWSRSLSDLVVAAMYAQIKAYYTARSIAI